MQQAPNASMPMAPPVAPAATGSEPSSSADEGAMAAAMAAGPQAGPAEHASMTRPSHNIRVKKAPMPTYGPAAQDTQGN